MSDRGASSTSAQLARLTAARAVALFVLLSLVPLALLAYFSVTLADEAVSREVEARVRATASASAEVVRRELEGLSELAESYARRPSLRSALAADRLDRATVATHLADLKTSRRGIFTAFLVDGRGRLVGIAPPTPSIVGRDFSFRDWYRGVRRTGGTYVSRAYRTQATGQALVVAAATPVRGDDGRVVGILAAAYDLRHLQRIADEVVAVERDVKLKVTDQGGVLVATPGGIRQLRSRTGDPRVAAALNGRAGVTTLQTPDGRRLSAYAPVRRFGWTVTASVPADTAFAAVGKLRWGVFAIAGVLAAAMMFGLILLLRALRARTRAETELNRLAHLQRAVLDAEVDGTRLVDRDGYTLVANPASEDLANNVLRMPPDGTIYDRWLAIADRMTDPAAFAAAVEELRKEPERTLVDEFELADARRTFVRYTAPVHDGSGELIGRIIVQREVTTEREAERLKSELVATVSHELRTPLTGILGFAELVRTHDLDEETRNRFLDTIYKEARRLTALINDFLDLQRIEAGALTLALEPVDVAGVLREQAEVATSHSEKHEVAVRLPEEPLVVVGDSERLKQVLGNLISNAVKYSPGGGSVTVGAETQNGTVRVSVSDEGLGIPADQQAQIFRKFFRVDTSDTRTIGGTGLGLALCREIVEAHGGRIGFESVEGEGSTFWFDLPTAHRQVGTGPNRVLVIEDEGTAAAFLAEFLGAEGFEVEVVATGEEGLRRALDDPPAVVCLDVALPGELDGWDVLNRLKDNPSTCDVPVVVCTAHNGRERARLFGAAEFLAKPIEPDRLRATLHQLVPRSHATVLVVDDDATVRALISETLAADGYDIVEAADGEDALEAIEDALPDAMILDLVMPRLDGFGLLERLQEDPRTSRLPVIVLTARDLSPYERERLRRRAASLLEKSRYSPDELRRLVRARVAAAPSARATA